MLSDFDFKQSQFDNSVSTSERLTRDLSQRKLELEKIETLDEKIASELTDLQAKLQSMDAELATFGDIPKLKADAERQKAEAHRRKEEALGKIESLKAREVTCKKTYDDLKKQLASDKVAGELEELENKMKYQEQTVFVLMEYIEARGAESNFEQLADTCLGMVGDINTETITALKERPLWNANAMPY